MGMISHHVQRSEITHRCFIKESHGPVVPQPSPLQAEHPLALQANEHGGLHEQPCRLQLGGLAIVVKLADSSTVTKTDFNFKYFTFAPRW